MSSSKCHQCGVAETVIPGSVCDTCRSNPGPTRPTACLSASPTPALVGVLPSGGYAVVGELGGGGMGVVYRAVQVATERTVAVKKLRPDAYTASGLRRFAAEARLLARVDHPNVVKLLDFVPDPHDPFLVMECVESVSLTRRVALGPPTADAAARLVADAARGVQAAHAAGVIHRDLKPGNLLVTPDDRVKVADFGLGKRLDVDDGLTSAGCSVGGTPGYLAPEQVDASVGTPGPRTDVWGLGACLYHALTGTAPFPTGMANVTRVLSDPLVPPRRVNAKVPAVLDAIACKCLEKDPAHRYATAGELADDLDRFRRGEPTAAKPLPWRVKAWRRVRAVPRAVAVAWAVAAAALLLVGIVAATTYRPEPADPATVLRNQYLAGETVTLVPKQGLPKWHEWALGRAELTDSPGRDGTAYFHPPGAAAVTLFDPPTDSYTLTADLLQRVVWDVKDEAVGRVGVMLFHRRAEADGGPDSVDSFLTIDFRDYDPGVLKNRPPETQPVEVQTWHHYHPNPNVGTTPGHYSVGGPPLVRFSTDSLPPGKWRRVVAEVAPTGLKVWWGADADDPACQLELVGEFTAAEMNHHYVTHYDCVTRPGNPNRMNPDLIPGGWSPRGGLGVWSSTSGLAFRNVTVRKNP